MKLSCLDCLLEIGKRLEEKRRAQSALLNEPGGNGVQQSQYFEGEIVALEFVQKVLNKALNRETAHATPAGPAVVSNPGGVPRSGAGEANGLGR